MAQPTRFASAASILAVASVLGGCVTSKSTTVTGAAFGGPVKNSEVGLATRALIALNSNDVGNAVTLAERAVEKTPDDAGFRALLGNAYFAAGRFASAEAAYKDSLTIYAKQPQVILKLALAEIAQGEGAKAVSLLNGARDVLDAANYGLAVALAGQPRVAVDILADAARQPGADSKVRQNLALAYGLSGDWTQARTVAAQDVPGDKLNARINEWMQFASPTHHSDQVASLTGVKSAPSDPGQPVRLALFKGETRLAQAAQPEAVIEQQFPVAAPLMAAPQPQVASAPVAQAQPLPQFAEVAPVPQHETQAPPPPPADPARVAAQVAEAAPPPPPPPAPAVFAAAAAAAPEAPAAFAAFAPKFTPKPRPAVHRAPAKPRPAAVRFAGKGPVMQLGAYRSPEYVSAAWTTLTRKYPALRAYLPLRARFDSPKGTFYRLSVQGFSTQREAIARCQLLKSRGGSCFVRGAAGDAPVEIASR